MNKLLTIIGLIALLFKSSSANAIEKDTLLIPQGNCMEKVSKSFIEKEISEISNERLGTFVSDPMLNPIDGSIVLGGTNFKFYQFDQNGGVKPVIPTNDNIECEPGFQSDGTIIVANNAGWISATSTDGKYAKKVKAFDAIGAIRGNIQVFSDDSYAVGDSSGNFYCFKPNGELSSQSKSQGLLDGNIEHADFYKSMKIDSENLLVSSDDGNVYKINGKTCQKEIFYKGNGKGIWDEPYKDPKTGTIIVTRNDGSILFLDDKGKEKFSPSFKAGNYFGGPVDRDPLTETYIAGSADGKVYLFDNEGKLKKEPFALSNPPTKVIGAPLALGNGLFAIGAMDGYLHFIKADGTELLDSKIKLMGNLRSKPLLLDNGNIVFGTAEVGDVNAKGKAKMTGSIYFVTPPKIDYVDKDSGAPCNPNDLTDIKTTLIDANPAVDTETQSKTGEAGSSTVQKKAASTGSIIK